MANVIRIYAWLLAVGLVALGALARASSVSHAEKPKVGLVLAGQGAAGLASTGVINALSEMGVQPTVICASGFSALPAALYATGSTPQEIDRTTREFARRFALENQGRAKPGDYPSDFEIWRELTLMFGAYDLAGVGIEKLPTRLCLWGLDISTGNSVAITSGSIARGLRAAMGSVWTVGPLTESGRRLTSSDAIRADLARAEGVDVLILFDPEPDLAEIRSSLILDGRLGDLLDMESLLLRGTGDSQLATLSAQDVLIHPPRGVSPDAYNDYDKLVAMGYAAVKAQSTILVSLGGGSSVPPALQISRDVRKRVKKLDVTENRFIPSDRVLKDFGVQPGDALGIAGLIDGLDAMFSTGFYKSVWAIPEVDSHGDLQLTLHAPDGFSKVPKEALPRIQEALRNGSDTGTMILAALAASKLGANAKPLVPYLVANLDRPALELRKALLVSLGELGVASVDQLPKIEQYVTRDDFRPLVPESAQALARISLAAADANAVDSIQAVVSARAALRSLNVVGEPLITVNLALERLGASLLHSLETLGKWTVWIGGALLLGTNMALFVAARRSAWAWRIATDDALSTAGLRLVTLALSHVPWAQLWILDLYFQRRKAELPAVKPFLSLPLTGGGATTQDSDNLLTPPWQGKHTWIQGRSGMGKTALFEHVTSGHFRNQNTAFDAYAAWGCIVIDFAARDYATGGEDKPEPDWVIDGVKGTLSRFGLTFDDHSLLRRILRSGSLAVSIDGLHEAGRHNSVEAFARSFEAAPLLVTSQEPGSQQFTNWRLPPDMRDYTRDLLRILMQNEQAANMVTHRIMASGLHDAIRSGYDLRLVSDLARADPEHAPLPSDRIGLYEAVLQAGWPEATEEEKAEQQRQTAAAAWRMVSERRPNEDKRRMKPDVELPAALLNALADAPDDYRRAVRLVRRVADAYEFVHDQMHAYLAARWFAQEGLTVSELENMVANSSIWAHAVADRRVLWSFAAALLDNERLLTLWSRVEDKEEWDVLRRELKAEAQRRGIG